MPDEKKFIVSLTEQELDDIDGGLSWTIDQMCPSDLWMEPRIKALREKIRRKLKRIRQLEKEISVEDMQKIVDANEKLVKELKDYAIHGK